MNRLKLKKLCKYLVAIPSRCRLLSISCYVRLNTHTGSNIRLALHTVVCLPASVCQWVCVKVRLLCVCDTHCMCLSTIHNIYTADRRMKLAQLLRFHPKQPHWLLAKFFVGGKLECVCDRERERGSEGGGLLSLSLSLHAGPGPLLMALPGCWGKSRGNSVLQLFWPEAQNLTLNLGWRGGGGINRGRRLVRYYAA